MLHDHVPSLVTKWSVVYRISSRQTFTDILNLCCDLDFECSNPVFHRTLQLMMLYYWNKFGCKWTSSLEDIVKTVIFWLYRPPLWPWHWRYKLIFPQDTLTHDNSPQYQVWFLKKWLRGSGDTEQTWSDTPRKYHQDIQTFWTFAMTLTLNAVIPLFTSTLWFMMMYYQTKFGSKLTSSLEDTTEIVVFWLYKPLLWHRHWTQWTNFSA